MRLIFFLIVLLNLALFAYGQGFFGVAPSELGREYRQFQERNPEKIKLGVPQSTLD